jgi:hypothetical protein
MSQIQSCLVWGYRREELFSLGGTRIRHSFITRLSPCWCPSLSSWLAPFLLSLWRWFQIPSGLILFSCLIWPSIKVDVVGCHRDGLFHWWFSDLCVYLCVGIYYPKSCWEKSSDCTHTHTMMPTKDTDWVQGRRELYIYIHTHTRVFHSLFFSFLSLFSEG